MSTNSLDTQIPEGVSFQADLPIAWEPLAAIPEITELAAVDARNEELLSALLALDDSAAEPEEDAQGEHWHRLDAKLDLAISLLAEVLSRQSELPPVHRLRLSGSWLAMEDLYGEERPTAGQCLRVRLYLSPRLPRALELVATVADAEVPDRVLLHLTGSGETTRNLLDRYVFRQHRRAVALARGLSTS